MGAAAGGGGGRATRALRLLLLLVLALAAVEYLFGSILEASPLRSYLHSPTNTTQSTLRLAEKPHSWPKKLSLINTNHNPVTQNTHTKNITISNISANNITKSEPAEQNNTVNSTNKNNINLVHKLNATIHKLNATVHKTNATNTEGVNMTGQEAYVRSTPFFITKIMEGLKNLVTTDSAVKKNETVLPVCEPSLELGPTPVNKTEVELDWVEKKYPEVQWGGRYSPPNCTAKHKVAIIVPFRDRQQHLAIFLNHMHPFLMKQQIEYGIFIVEQDGASDFNRAKLMNVGFVESMRLKDGGWQCFIFHDIDLLPLDLRNIYSCPRQPRHMSASIDKLNFKLPYEEIFGGVSAMTLDQFTKVNGFSNKYWGWGGEDDDMYYRLKKMKYHIARYKMSIARYAMLDHKKSAPNPKRYQLLSQTSKTFQKDGLSTLEYEVVQVVQHHLYTHVLVNIDERS